jgi:UDP-glucose 4-epimerase
MEVVIVRPPLVYGPGVKANFRTMMKWLERGMPLPLGAVDNRRSLVALDNLVDLLVLCGRHPQAPGQVFLASDGEALSTTDLLRRLGRVLGRPARLIPVPPSVLATALRIAGRRDLASRLFGSLEIDGSAAHERLGWTPPISVDEALAHTARAFLADMNRRDTTATQLN